MRRLFGTDGARDIASADLTCELAMNVSRAAAMVLGKGGKRHPKILAGKDTRISSDMLESTLAAGLCSIDANVVHLDVVPTPTIAYLAKKYGTDAGVMVSASYNPYEFNGIKISSSIGYKLLDALEEQTEVIVLDHEEKSQFPTGGEAGSILVTPQTLRGYMDHVKSTVSENAPKGPHVTLDCVDGFSMMAAQTLFTGSGAECHMLSGASNGVNINDNCGSTHIGALMQYVKVNYMDAGPTSDGDADRYLAVDEQGQLVDGDFLMTICTLDLRSQGRLAKSVAVGTIVTDMGFIRFCEENGIRFAATEAGDRYMLEGMLQGGYNFDGEQSGYIIFLDRATMGDGQVTGVRLLTILSRRRAHLSSPATLMARYPQVMASVTVNHEDKLRFYIDAEVDEAVERAKARLGVKGHVVVRSFGTEPLLRVMIGGESHDEISALAYEVVGVVYGCLA